MLCNRLTTEAFVRTACVAFNFDLFTSELSDTEGVSVTHLSGNIITFVGYDIFYFHLEKFPEDRLDP